MITRSTATLQLLIGLFAAGAVTCAVGLVRTLLGYPVQAWEFALFLGVACTVTGYGWQQLVKAEYSRERGFQERERVITAERLAALAARNAALAEPPTLLPASEPEPDDSDWWPALYTWFTNGHRAGGFSDGRIGPLQTEDDWKRLTTFYASDAGLRVLRLDAGSVGYVLNFPMWSHHAILREIGNHKLPHPQGDAPDVDAIGADAARRGARRGESSGAGGQEVPV